MFTSQLCKSFLCSSLCLCNNCDSSSENNSSNNNNSESENHEEDPLLSSTPPKVNSSQTLAPAMPIPIRNTYGKPRKVYGSYDSNFGSNRAAPRTNNSAAVGLNNNVNAFPVNQGDTKLTDNDVNLTASPAEVSIFSMDDVSIIRDGNGAIITNLIVQYGGLSIAEPTPPDTNLAILGHLKPITDAYFADSGIDIKLDTWETIFGENDELEKIAEASFAEVYRFKTVSGGDSILKIMNLKIPTDAASLERDTSILVKDVVPEIRIMYALTVVPGFVTFKAAHLIIGKTPNLVNTAYDQHVKQVEADGGSYFPHPLEYGSDSVFLVVELGNAGTVLENLEITSTTQVYDVIIGVTLALARAETLHEFEHRDLHENNMCYSIKDSSDGQNPPPGVKFGRSGIEITIIDYGLSRAKMQNGEIIFNDLERDLAVFQSESQSVDKEQKALEKLQFDTYRFMRHYLYTGQVKSTTKKWHTPESAVKQGSGHSSWAAYIPLTNVFWIRYLLKWLTKNLPMTSDHKQFCTEIAEFEKKLRSRRGTSFNSAMEVLEYFVKAGWIAEEQLGVDEEDSILSQELSRISVDDAEEADTEATSGESDDENDDDDDSEG